jgi:outer membrane immunogenic protein
MRRILIASAAFASLFAATSASAADLPVYPKAAPMAVYDWTGFYLGTNVGYSWGRATTSGTYAGTQSVTTFLTAPTGGNPGPQTTLYTPLDSGTLSGRADVNGFVGGGQFGYNWQLGGWLAGLEADIQGSGESGRVPVATTLVTAGAVAGVLPGPGFAADYSLKWFGTARGRLGFLATERLLLYATGGLAYGDITGGSPTLAYSFSSLKAGWTVGAGAEAALGSNWSVKFEYLYMDLGNVGDISANTVTFYNSVAGVAGRTNTTVTQQAYSYLFNTKFTDSIVRVGLNYKFGGPGVVVAKY